MIDRLLDFLLEILDLFRFWTVIDAFEEGVVLRLGKYSRTIGPGLHLMLPFGLEEDMTESVVPTTKNLGPQSLTTFDDVAVVVSGVITYRIHDIKKVLLEVEDAETCLEDSSYGVIGEMVNHTEWDSLIDAEFHEELSKMIRKRAWRWGIEVMQVQLAEVAKCWSVRLWNDE